jgi:hypothetical protein
MWTFRGSRTVDAVIQYARTMTWKGKHPVVELVTTTYQTGVKLTKETMKGIETQLQRLPLMDKWFVDIGYPLPAIRDQTSPDDAGPSLPSMMTGLSACTPSSSSEKSIIT